MADYSDTRIQFRRGTAAEWSAAAPVILGSGEPGFVTDTNTLKIGDGTTAFTGLSEFVISNTAGITGASGISNIVYISSGDYAALGSYDATTLYFVN